MLIYLYLLYSVLLRFASLAVGVIKMYETRLQELNPNVRNIQYDVKDLHAYVDHLGDLVALV